jgi:hypothetical protein
VTAKNGVNEWWLNRKSRLGLTPAAKPAPHLPKGEPWWTEPPVAAPEPEWIEYAIAYRRELRARLVGARGEHLLEVQALLGCVNDWLAKARRLLHERVQAPERSDLHTTEGLLIAASRALHKMRSRIYGLGGEADAEIEQIMQAVQARADESRRRRATDAACARPAAKAAP